MNPFFKLFFICLVLLLATQARTNAQIKITGSIVNSKNEPVASASIHIKESGIGVMTDSAGRFTISSDAKGKIILQVSSVGYDSWETEINPSDSIIHQDIKLQNESKILGEVIVISAGSFEASDKAKGASLTPIDAVTVAGNGGDIANALRVLPGAQVIGEQEGLFVRGGTNEETKQFIDGGLMTNPNFSPVPGLPQPARLNPFLFKGILFSTGGYSALYGGALSGALILESVDLPDQTSSSAHFFPTAQGAGFQELAQNNKSSYGINLNYGNQHFYDHIVPQKPVFLFGPEYLSADANFRIKTSLRGVLKFNVNCGYGRTGMRNPDIDSLVLQSSYEVKSLNLYSTLSYRESLKNKWKLDAAIVYDFYKENIKTQLQDRNNKQLFLPDYPYSIKNNMDSALSGFAQARIVLSKSFLHRQALRFGVEYFYSNDFYNNNDTLTRLKDRLAAAFAERDIYLARKMAARVGVRVEHSSLLDQWNLAPRISMAYQFNDGGQINMAYGIFYQKPGNKYLIEYRNLGFTQATHYIINYQKKAKNRLFRVEAYYKWYKDLVITQPAYSSNGNGYARGLELFWRDRKTVRDFDYWVTYTYLDTKRKFLNYPDQLEPGFSTPHTITLVGKKFFEALNLSANLSYSIATGRPYYHIVTNGNNIPAVCEKGRTNTYNNLNLSFAYLFNFFRHWKNKDFSGIGFGANNITGSRQVFGYNFSYNGTNKVPITAPAIRSYYIGIFMTFGIDRRDDFINENL